MENILDRIGKYFAEQETQMQHAIDTAITSNQHAKDAEEYHESELRSSSDSGRSGRRLKRCDESSSNGKAFSNAVGRYKPVSKPLQNSNQELEQSMTETMQKHIEQELKTSENLYQQAIDVEADTQVAQRAVAKKRTKRKKKKKKSKESIALATLAAQKKLQAERQLKHLKTVALVEERARKIREEVRAEQRLEAQANLARREKIEKELGKLEVIRKKGFKSQAVAAVEETPETYQRSPRIDPKTKFLTPSVEQHEEVLDEALHVIAPAPPKVFLTQLAWQQRDQIIYEAKIAKKRALVERSEAKEKARIDLDARIRQRELDLAIRKESENNQELERLEQLVERKKLMLRNLDKAKGETRSIRQERYNFSEAKKAARIAKSKLHQRKLAEFVEENYAAWEADEEELVLKAANARNAAKSRISAKNEVSQKTKAEESSLISEEDRDFLTSELEDDEFLSTKFNI